MTPGIPYRTGPPTAHRAAQPGLRPHNRHRPPRPSTDRPQAAGSDRVLAGPPGPQRVRREAPTPIRRAMLVKRCRQGQIPGSGQTTPKPVFARCRPSRTRTSAAAGAARTARPGPAGPSPGTGSRRLVRWSWPGPDHAGPSPWRSAAAVRAAVPVTALPSWRAGGARRSARSGRRRPRRGWRALSTLRSSRCLRPRWLWLHGTTGSSSSIRAHRPSSTCQPVPDGARRLGPRSAARDLMQLSGARPGPELRLLAGRFGVVPLVWRQRDVNAAVHVSIECGDAG